MKVKVILSIATLWAAPAFASNLWHAEYATYGALTSVISWSDTPPSASAGSQIMSVTFTPTTPHVRAIVTFKGTGSGPDQGCVVTLLKDGSVIDVSASVPNDTFFAMTPITMTTVQAVTPNVQTTFTVRAGPRLPGECTTNGYYNTRLFGGVSKSTFDIEEVTLGE